MLSNASVEQVAAALHEASRLLLLGHISPDGDSLGSLLALRQILLHKGKQVAVYVPDGVPARYRFLPGASEVLHDSTQLPEGDVTVVVLDCGEWDRVGLAADRFSGQVVVNIDHHRTSRGLGQANYLDSDAAATGLLLMRLFAHWQEKLDVPTATCLYTAIASDTGFFRYSNTTAEVHQVAAQLLAAGAEQELVTESLEGKTISFLKALGLVLERLSMFAGDKGAYSYLKALDLETLGISSSEVDGLVNYPRSLVGVQVAAFLVEVDPDVFKVSLRSRPPLDVSVLAAQFGGGGHARAAGCTLRGSIDECLEQLAGAVEKEG
jgi:phosphoesterase RecJ-like protein